MDRAKEYILPAEITIDILSRLPVEKVLECRRVSKTFNTLLHHPSFAYMHLLRHSLQLNDDDNDDDDDNVDDDDDHAQNYQNCNSYAAAAKVGFVSLIELENSRCQLYYTEYDENDEQQSYKTPKKINHPPFDNNSVMVGSCNGLICLCVNHHGVQDPVYIYNPITKEYVDLPWFEDNKCSNGGPLGGRIVFGFGYHTIADEYKVVRIFYRQNQPTIGQVQVYTLGDGRGWRNKGEINYTSRLFSLPPQGIFANGALHWLAFGDGKIVSFDLAEEEFFFLPSPPCVCSGDYYQLQVLGGSLCAFNQEEDGCVNIWSLKKKKKKKNSSDDIMKEQEYQPWSWSLAFSIESEDIYDTNFMDEYDPFALTKNCELLLWYCGGILFRYNLKNSILEKLVGYVPEWEFFDAIPHMNSFISLKALGEDAKIIGSA